MKISYLLSLFVLIGTPASAHAFTDVPSDYAYKNAIDYVYSQGIVDGYADGTFRPDHAINRVEFTKIITLYRWDQKTIDMCGSKYFFPDLQTDAWYVKYICRAQNAHLIDGYPDGLFRPEQSINFAEAAKIIASASSQSTSDPRLPEVAADAPWYEKYVQFLSERNAIPSSIEYLDDKLSRGEMAEIIFQLDIALSGGSFPESNNTIDERYLDMNYWIPYTYPQHGLSISFPASFHVTTEVVNSYPNGKQWFRVDASDSSVLENPRFRIEANPDGYGPLFPDQYVRITETEGGGIRNIGESSTVENIDGSTLVTVESYEAKNGNTYSMRLFLDIDESAYDNYATLLWKIFSSIRLSDLPDSEPNAPVPYESPQGRFSAELPSDSNIRVVNKSYNLPILESGTLLNEKYMTVIEGANHVLCTDPGVNFEVATSANVTINGITYKKESGYDRAMHSIYDSVRYTTLWPNYTGSICTSITFTLRYGDPSPYDIPPPDFKRELETRMFDEIMESVRFE